MRLPRWALAGLLGAAVAVPLGFVADGIAHRSYNNFAVWVYAAISEFDDFPEYQSPLVWAAVGFGIAALAATLFQKRT